MSIRNVNNDVFERTGEGRRVLTMEPWHFDNALVMLKEIGDIDTVDR